VRHEIAETRAHLGETAAELKQTIAQRAGRAKQAVSPAHYASEYPWVALGLALGAGLALALTGAEAKTARAAAGSARRAGTAIGDGAIAAANAVADKLSRDSAPEPRDEPDRGERSAIHALLDDGLEEALVALGVTRDEVQRRMLSS
jgi:hypothetical protein